ncbi:MAG: hypothetical protein KDC45_15325 [Bacteroidetes bacterium]|nr:hypothetical protein [Bacteroidota bacterium]
MKLTIAFLFGLAGLSPIHAQNWETHRFEGHHLEFKTPPHWQVTIRSDSIQAYIECLRPDQDMYLFITSAINEKQSSPEIVLTYLKVTYSGCDFIRQESKKVNNIDFLFTSGINSMSEIKTFIKLGVGIYEDRIFMVDSGYSDVNNDEDDQLLNSILESLKATR